jgi:hypothetical protein
MSPGAPAGEQRSRPGHFFNDEDDMSDDGKNQKIAAMIRKGATVKAIVEQVGASTTRIADVRRELAADPDAFGDLDGIELDDDQQQGDDDEDNVIVPRAYLLTLEALRDQVLETARLRRALELRADQG